MGRELNLVDIPRFLPVIFDNGEVWNIDKQFLIEHYARHRAKSRYCRDIRRYGEVPGGWTLEELASRTPNDETYEEYFEEEWNYAAVRPDLLLKIAKECFTWHNIQYFARYVGLQGVVYEHDDHLNSLQLFP